MTTPPWQDYQRAAPSTPPWRDYRPARPPPPSGSFAGARASGAVPSGSAEAFIERDRQDFQRGSAGFLANVNRGLGIGDEIAAGMNSAVNAVRGRDASFDASMAQQRRLEETGNPRINQLGRGAGMALTAATPLGPASDVVTAGRALNALKGATAGGLTAAAYTAADAGTPQERLSRAADAARDPIALGLGALGGGVSARGRAPRGANPNLRALRAADVEVTPGQIAGGALRHAEDAAQSSLILGQGIRDARRRGLVGYTRGAINNGLRVIGEKLPAGVSGHEAVAYAGDRFSAGYEGNIPTRPIRIDQGFGDAVRTDAGPIIATLTPENAQRLHGILDSRLTSRQGADGTMSGETFKRVTSELGLEARRFRGSPDPDHQAMADAIDANIRALQNAAARQDPRYAARLARLDRGYALHVRAENAAANAGATEGNFGPGQYGVQVKRGDARTRSRGYARGEAMGQGYERAGRAVLPSTIGDTGTADRAAINHGIDIVTTIAAAGAGGATHQLAPVLGATGALWLARQAYGPRVIGLVNKALDRSIAAADRRAAQYELQRLAGTNDQLRRRLAPVLRRLPQAIGVGAGASERQQQDQPAQ